MYRSATVSFLSVFLFLACEDKPASSAPAVLSVHSFLTAPPGLQSSRSLGEDCSVHGKSVCRTGLCLHVEPDPSKGWFCATKCTSDKECPEAWSCGAIYPGFKTCAPPKKWVAKAVAARGAVAP